MLGSDDDFDVTAYDDAVSRLLDGLDVPEGAEGAEATARARAVADVALIGRALKIIGSQAAGEADAEAAEPGDPAVVGAGSEVDACVLPLRPVPPPAELVELGDVSAPARRRIPPAGVLAAAASLVLVAAVGVASIDDRGGSGSDGNSAVQQPAPVAADADEQPVPVAPAPNADAAAPAADAATDAAAASAAGTAAAADSAPRTMKAKSPAARSAEMPLAQAAACSRAILLGEVVSVVEANRSGRSQWTLRVRAWVRPTFGPAEVIYAVGGPRARLAAGGLATLPPGQRGLFLVPGDKGAPLRAWTGLDEGSGRQKVEAALEKGWSGGC